MKLAGKTALVTGGTRGIGKAVVWALAREGAKVAFVYTSSDEVAGQLVKDLELDQRVAASYKADVRSRVEADAVVEKVIEAWGQIDILVNNAGIIRDGLLATMDETAWNDVIQTNLTSVYNYCHAVIRPMMSARKGRIINMSATPAK
jgi:3-oxoacyl-[acyl-carrier protein] reductase